VALNFLLDEWLVDVVLDNVGKCEAIMLAMTLIERALLTERQPSSSSQHSAAVEKPPWST